MPIPIRSRRSIVPSRRPAPRGAGVLLVAHGSRCFASLDQIATLTNAVAERLPEHLVDVGFLQLSTPEIASRIDAMVESGCRSITVVPLLLLRATHSRSDVPAVIAEAQRRHPQVEFVAAEPLGPSLTLNELAVERISTAGGSGKRLLIVSQGSSDPAALGDIIDSSVAVAEAVGVASLSNAFARAAKPSVADVVRALSDAGDDVVVFYWVLSHGKLVEDARAELSAIPVIEAGIFGPHPSIVELVVQRVTG